MPIVELLFKKMRKRLDSLLFSMQSTFIAKTLLSTKKESVDETVLEERIPWSVFWVRKRILTLGFLLNASKLKGITSGLPLTKPKVSIMLA